MIGESRSNMSGVFWSAVEKFSIQGSQFLVTLVVARLLLPADYGLIAMMSIFIALSIALVDSGMAQAIIQRKERTERDLTTALVFNVGVSLLLYAIIYLSAPYIALFYDSPQLVGVARLYSLVFVINSFSVVQQALIAVALDFRRQAVATLSGVILGGVVAIYLAWSGYGVWALVWQQIVASIITTLLLWTMSPWRPKGAFSWSSFRVLSQFGSKIMLSGLIHVLYTNLYTVLIGRKFAPTTLGLYNRTTTISALPSSNISTIVDRALYPILCRQQSDKEAVAESLFRYLRMVCFFVFPIMVGISLMARPLVLVLLGENWLGVVPLLQVVALANMWDPVMKLTGSLIRSQGRSADFLRAEVLKKVCGVAILLFTLPHGVVVMCWGLVLYAVIDMLIVIFFCRLISLRLGYINIVRELLPTLLLTLFMGVVVWFLSRVIGEWGAAIQLLVAFVVGGGVYIGAALVMRSKEVNFIKNRL